MCSESAAVSRDLPMPGSPEISTTRPSPLFACCQRRSSSSISSSRPTSGVSPERNASNRLSIAALANDPPRRLRLGKAGKRLRPEIGEFEQPADLPARRFGDDQRVRRGKYSRGEDVIAGVVETHGRKPIVELVAKYPSLPGVDFEYKELFEEMDVDAIVARKPAVAVIDRLAHTNVEGSKHRKRYEDVIELLDAGIDVLSTMNVQHIESMTPMVRSITGVTVRETVPDWVMQRVNEIVLADLTPEALRHRMERGDIYPVERAERASPRALLPAR